MNPYDPTGPIINQTLSGLGQSIGSTIYKDRMETKLKGLMAQAASDPEALNELSMLDPQVAAMLEQRMQKDQQELIESAGNLAYNALQMDDPAKIRAYLQSQAEGASPRLQAEIADTLNMDDDQMMNDLKTAYSTYSEIGKGGRQSSLQFGAQQTFKDSQGNLYFGTQARDPRGNVQSMLSPIGDAPEKPVGSVQVVGAYGLTASERVNQTAAESGAKTTAEKNAQIRTDYIKQGSAAKSMIPKIKKLLELNDAISTGKTAKARKFFGDLFNVTDPDLGQFNALAGQLVLDNIRALGANPTEGERAFLQQITPSIEQGSEVNEAILNDILEVQKRQVERAKWLVNNPGKSIEEYLITEEDFIPSSLGSTDSAQEPAGRQNLQNLSDEELFNF